MARRFGTFTEAAGLLFALSADTTSSSRANRGGW